MATDADPGQRCTVKNVNVEPFFLFFFLQFTLVSQPPQGDDKVKDKSAYVTEGVTRLSRGITEAPQKCLNEYAKFFSNLSAIL